MADQPLLSVSWDQRATLKLWRDAAELDALAFHTSWLLRHTALGVGISGGLRP